MGKASVERKLRRAVKHATPDMKEQVMAKCREAKVDKSTPIIMRTRNRRMETIYALIAAAAVILLSFNVGLDVYNNSVQSRVMTVVDIDVNPSIELKINQDDRIVSVRAINSDAVAILDGMDLKGTQTKVAVNAIMGSMFEHGYLQGETDSVLVSVSNKDASKSEAIQSDITDNIDSLMKAYSRDVSVIGQTIYEGDPDLVNLSNAYGISEGKAALINKIISYNDIYTFDDLVSLNITELNEIICSMEDMNNEKVDENTDDYDPKQPGNANIESDQEPVIGDSAVSENNIPASDTEERDAIETVSGNDISVSDNDPEQLGTIIDEKSSVSDNSAQLQQTTNIAENNSSDSNTTDNE